MARLLHLILLIGCLASVTPAAGDDTKWPEPDADSRPWLRWWWPSDLSCPEEPDDELKEIAAHGFGGVEVLPLGAEGDTLWPGPGWAPRASATASLAEELGLGFDLATFAGRRPLAFGAEDAGRQWFPYAATARGGPLRLELPEGIAHCLAAWPPQGQPIDLLEAIDPETKELVWDAPAGSWRIYGLFDEPASPALDPFSPVAIKDALASFDLSLADYEGPFPRSRPLERTGAEYSDWTHQFFERFLALRGYDLREQLPALLGDGPGGVIQRVRCDYRETLSDLYRVSLETWQDHTRNQGSLTRTLLHAQPGHPLELHGVADFPGVAGIPVLDPELHLAASAAHLTMKPLVVATYTPDPSSTTTPADIKRHLDDLWLQGANHIMLDGRSSLLDPSQGELLLDDPGGLWGNLQPLSDYITRCQSILQLGAPDPDLLLYYPAHDFWSERGGIPSEPAARREWLRPTGYQRAFEGLSERGVTFDTTSDRLLEQAEVIGDGLILIAGLTYKGLILPEVRRLPEQTAVKLLELARRGARISALGELPQDVPGFPNPDIRRGTLIQAFQQLPDASTLESDDLDELIDHLRIQPEPMAKLGLRHIRRSHPEGSHYFIVNTGTTTVDSPVRLSRPAESVVKLDPRDHQTSGIAPRGASDDGALIHLHLEPGESIVLRTFRERTATGPEWAGPGPATHERLMGGTWRIQLNDLPPIESPILGSWRTLSSAPSGSHSQTATYTIEFEATEPGVGVIDLGTVAHTARVRVNGQQLGTSFAPPHRLNAASLIKKGRNQLEIEVTSLADHDLPAGLLGPVRLITPSSTRDSP
ncbi:glycosyl hydrolase [Haloferula rosea]|uniref:Glycosyl hydrolases family 2 sugar binding domain-containing protein n=1 Tax=Haloferula rosea TaxID=490093 RepID=A0A934VAC0_9BACT|nr:glycosyl hydrolase [Haloferula rosea]MBK1826143.1 hypothetical protein [Haloferula rosea]